MKITGVEGQVEHLELTRPYTIATGTFEAVEVVFVRVETDSGLVGAGAGSPRNHVTGEGLSGCLEALGGLRERLVGQDLGRLQGLLRHVEGAAPAAPAARAAVDMALWDLRGQEVGLPLVEVLGRAHESLPTSITIGIKETPEETEEEAREYLERGFRHLKVKTGFSPGQDLEALERIRELAGRVTEEPVRVRVDANQGYDREGLAEFIGGVESRGWGVGDGAMLELIEQPLPKGETEIMGTVPEEVRRWCAADEVLLSPTDALALAAEPRAFGIFNIKLMKCGGVTPGLQIAEIARLAGVELMWGCMDESVVSIAAALHAALACPATRYLDLDGSLDLARDLARGGFRLEDGRLSTLGTPGLGVTLEG